MLNVKGSTFKHTLMKWIAVANREGRIDVALKLYDVLQAEHDKENKCQTK